MTVTLDPAGPFVQQGTVDAINLTIAGFTFTAPTTAFLYAPIPDLLVIGGGGSISLDSPNDFIVRIDSALSGTPLPSFFAYEVNGIGVGLSTNFSVSVVPEPGTLALLGGGVLGLGLALRRRHRVSLPTAPWPGRVARSRNFLSFSS